MARIVLAIGGNVLGNLVLPGIGGAIGGAIGGYVGGIIDQHLFGPETGRRKVQAGQVADFRLSGSAYGEVRPSVWGRGRVPANIIWLRGIREEVQETIETDESGETVTTKAYRYFADVALGLGEGPLDATYRIWVDGQALDPDRVGEIRFYKPRSTLLPACCGRNARPALLQASGPKPNHICGPLLASFPADR